MGKIRTRFLGEEEVEKQQVQEQKERSQAKKAKAPTVINESENQATETKNGQPEVKKVKLKKTLVLKKPKHGKKYLMAKTKITKNNVYSLEDAVNLLKEMSYASFDETIEVHLNLLNEGLKGEVSFPHATGKSVSVVVLDEAIIKKIEDGVIDFDILVAHPSQMPKLAKFAKILGPKGLMPNPKTGTVSTEPDKVAEKFRNGSTRWKSESKFPIIHQIIGKKSLENKAIIENIKAFIESVGVKNITSAYIAGSMTPSVQIVVS
jgi:large subunit ribosomal protein L1